MADIGITSYGIHVPRYRINGKTISAAIGWLSSGALRGEKAVANYDEDSLSMAVNAGMECLQGTEPAKVGGMYFASTTPPYRERESSTIIATALDLQSGIRTADFANSVKAGTAAILSACDTVRAGNAGSVIVCGADCRVGKPGSVQETIFGDGAGAILVGSEGVIATLEGSYSVAYDFPDYRRTKSDKYVRTVEDRFIREEGFGKFIPEAISGLLKKCKLEAKDIAKIGYPCLNAREHANAGKRLGFQPEQIQPPMLSVIGNTGAASPLIILAAMLEEAKPGDNIIVASYGNGAEALLLKVTPEIEKVKGKGRLDSMTDKADLTSYEQYLAFRGMLPMETGSSEDIIATTQLPLAWRERRTLLALYGSVCKKCGTPQYPAQRICANPDCGAVDEMEDYRFADKQAEIFSYTADYTSPTLDPPLIFSVINFEGGGRFIFELTDCDLDALKVGLPVKMSLRRKYFDEPRGIVGYSWKAIPIRNERK